MATGMDDPVLGAWDSPRQQNSGLGVAWAARRDRGDRQRPPMASALDDDIFS